MFDPGGTGLLVPPQDIVALKNALNTLATDKELCTRLSSNTKNFLEQRFGVHNTVEKYIEIVGR